MLFPARARRLIADFARVQRLVFDRGPAVPRIFLKQYELRIDKQSLCIIDHGADPPARKAGDVSVVVCYAIYNLDDSHFATVGEDGIRVWSWFHHDGVGACVAHLSNTRRTAFVQQMHEHDDSYSRWSDSNVVDCTTPDIIMMIIKPNFRFAWEWRTGKLVVLHRLRSESSHEHARMLNRQSDVSLNLVNACIVRAGRGLDFTYLDTSNEWHWFDFSSRQHRVHLITNTVCLGQEGHGVSTSAVHETVHTCAGKLRTWSQYHSAITNIVHHIPSSNTFAVELFSDVGFVVVDVRTGTMHEYNFQTDLLNADKVEREQESASYEEERFLLPVDTNTRSCFVIFDNIADRIRKGGVKILPTSVIALPLQNARGRSTLRLALVATQGTQNHSPGLIVDIDIRSWNATLRQVLGATVDEIRGGHRLRPVGWIEYENEHIEHL